MAQLCVVYDTANPHVSDVMHGSSIKREVVALLQPGIFYDAGSIAMLNSTG